MAIPLLVEGALGEIWATYEGLTVSELAASAPVIETSVANTGLPFGLSESSALRIAGAELASVPILSFLAAPHRKRPLSEISTGLPAFSNKAPKLSHPYSGPVKLGMRKVKGKRTKKRYGKKSRGRKGSKNLRGNFINDKFPVSSKRVGFKGSKRRSTVFKASRALNKLADASGDIITHLEPITSTSSTTGDTCGFTAFFALTGVHCSDVNGNDILKMFCVVNNKSSGAGNLAIMQKLKQKLFIHSVDISFYFRESGTAQCLLDIYECVSKRTCSTAEYGTTFANMLTASLARDSMPSLITANELAATDPYVTPYIMAEFGKYWKIYKQSTINVNNGTTNIYHVHINLNRYLDPDEVLIDNDYFKGLSRMFLFRHRGDMTGANFNDSTLNVKAEYIYRYTSAGVDGQYVVRGVSAPTT